MRIGVVFDPNGGMLASVSFPFKLGIGGVIGSGNQFLSWITLNDMYRAIDFCIKNPNIKGPVNFREILTL
jgi:NAD dependent epimerase/dehydratase family enzyme